MMNLFRRARPATRKGPMHETIDTVVWAVVLFLILRTFVVQAFRIPSPSMEDTLMIGDFLFINKVEYGARIPFTDWRLPGLRDPRPGDIIVFQKPSGDDPGEREVDFIKRCVAVGGQTVEMREKRLLVDGLPQVEPYALNKDPFLRPERDDWGPLTVPENQLFMLGDNRDYSHDSRFWGCVPMEKVRGRAFIRYFSWDGEKKRIRFNRMFRPVR